MANSSLRDYLRDDFADRRKRNPRFSLRSYAKFLSISPSHLSLILSNQRKVKAKSALKITDRLGLTPTEAFQLYRSERGAALQKARDLRVLQEDEFALISEWFYFAILGLADLKHNIAKPEWISRSLGIPLEVAKKALSDLIAHQYIAVRNGQFRQVANPLRTTDDVSNRQIRRYHKQNLQLAIEKIDTVDVAHREYTSLTLAISPKRLKAAKELIRKFKEEFDEEVCRGDRSEVYHLGIQFFPLTQSESRAK